GYKTRLTFQVQLPNVFEQGDGDPVSFSVTALTDNHSSWEVGNVEGRVPSLHLGPSLAKDLYLKYRAADSSWEGGLNLYLDGDEDGYAIDLRAPEEGGTGGPGAGLGVRGGRLSHLGGAFDFGSNEVQIYAGVFLRKLRLSLVDDPVVLAGGVTLHIVKVFFVDGDGALVLATPRDPYVFPRQTNVGMNRLAGTRFDSWAFVSGGNLYLEEQGQRWDLGGGYVLVRPGEVRTGSKDHIDLFGVASLGGGFDGAVNTRTGAFNLGGTMRVCIAGVLCDDTETLISSAGIAACKEVPPFGFSVGAGYRWGGSPDVFLEGCDLGDYRANLASARAGGGGRTFRVARGSRGVQLEVTGAAGPPDVVVSGPGGRTFSSDGKPRVWTTDHAILRSSANRTTYIALRRPAAGTWTVTARGGDALTGARMRDALAPAGVTVRVSGGGARRVLSYRLTSAKGRRVTFYESSRAGGLRQLGPARAASGRLTFAPQQARGSARQIRAVVTQDGLPVSSTLVARFAYATPKPPRPSGLRVVRGRRTLTVRWGRSPGAVRYQVRALARSGQQLLADTRRPSVRLAGLDYYLRGTVRVTPVRADGVRGASAAAPFPAQRAETRD
ncbi:MAG TPA: hypothetical protein VMT10_15725, partial [Solirubrobacteraceae bacterium]|nr:hypothetical protein [Solirubrobacteraceae bacterium]